MLPRTILLSELHAWVLSLLLLPKSQYERHSDIRKREVAGQRGVVRVCLLQQTLGISPLSFGAEESARLALKAGSG
jgi:hypothetical protein